MGKKVYPGIGILIVEEFRKRLTVLSKFDIQPQIFLGTHVLEFSKKMQSNALHCWRKNFGWKFESVTELGNLIAGNFPETLKKLTICEIQVNLPRRYFNDFFYQGRNRKFSHFDEAGDRNAIFPVLSVWKLGVQSFQGIPIIMTCFVFKPIFFQTISWISLTKTSIWNFSAVNYLKGGSSNCFPALRSL